MRKQEAISEAFKACKSNGYKILRKNIVLHYVSQHPDDGTIIYIIFQDGSTGETFSAYRIFKEKWIVAKDGRQKKNSH